MTKTEMQNQAVELFNQINTMYPVIYNSVGNDMTRVVEYKGVKYKLQYYEDTLLCIYKNGTNSTLNVYHIDKNTVKELNKFISTAKQVLKGEEIQDGLVLKIVESKGEEYPFYSATIRFECEIDSQLVIGVFAKVNEWSLSTKDTYAVFLDEYHGQRSAMGSATAKLTISNEYSIEDIKAMLLVFDAELPDCHVAIQSLDYAQFDGLRDRSSHYPTNELVEEWSNKLSKLKK